MRLDLQEQVRLQHRLGQLFHKQGHPIGLRDYLLHHVRGQYFATRDLPYQLFYLWAGQAAEREGGQIRPQRPGQPFDNRPYRATRTAPGSPTPG
jgi:hypothetical protein